MNRTSYSTDPAELEVADAAAMDPGAWNGLIAELNGPFVQSHSWARCMAQMSGADCRYLTIRKEGSPAAAGWYALSSTRIGPVAVSRSMEMESLPCYDPSRITAGEVVRAVIAAAHRHGAGDVRFGNSPAEYRPELPEKGTVEKTSFTLDLGLPQEALFGNLADGVRRKLRKAERNGISVTRIDRGDDPVLELVPPLFGHTIAKHISSGKRRDRSEADFFLHAVRELLSNGNAVLFMAFREQDPLSCVLLSTFDRHALYLFGGSAPQGYRLNASYTVMWTALTALKDRGFLSFSLGEVRAAARDEADGDHGLYRFKKEFGGAEKQLYSGSIITRPVQHQCLSFVKRVRHAFSR